MKDALYNWVKLILNFITANRLIAIGLFILGVGSGTGLNMLLSSPSEPVHGDISIGEVQSVSEIEKAPVTCPDCAEHTHDEYALKHDHKCNCDLDELIRENDR